MALKSIKFTFLDTYFCFKLKLFKAVKLNFYCFFKAVTGTSLNFLIKFQNVLEKYVDNLRKKDHYYKKSNSSTIITKWNSADLNRYS